MNEYHKIQTIFKRDMANRGKIMEGTFSEPEFEYLKNNEWVFTEKVDGTNIRVMWNGKAIVFGGKTDNAQIPAFLVTRLEELFLGIQKRKLFEEVFAPKEQDEEIKVCLYGEGYGAKIQKGGGNYIPNGVDFVLFDVKIGDWWLQRENIEDIATKFKLKTVPVIGKGTLKEMVEMTKKGFKSQWGEFIAEGIVPKPATELRTRGGDRIITKIKYKDFNN